MMHFFILMTAIVFGFGNAMATNEMEAECFGVVNRTQNNTDIFDSSKVPWGLSDILKTLGFNDNDDDFTDEDYIVELVSTDEEIEDEDEDSIEPASAVNNNENSLAIDRNYQLQTTKTVGYPIQPQAVYAKQVVNYPVVKSLTDFFKQVDAIAESKMVKSEKVLVWLDWDLTIVSDSDIFLDADTNEILNRELQKGYRIIINTARGHDLHGCQDVSKQIQSIVWHYESILLTGINLSSAFPHEANYIRLEGGKQNYFHPIFCNGILFAGMKKREALVSLMSVMGYNPDLVFGLDDNTLFLCDFPVDSNYHVFRFDNNIEVVKS